MREAASFEVLGERHNKEPKGIHTMTHHNPFRNPSSKTRHLGAVLSVITALLLAGTGCRTITQNPMRVEGLALPATGDGMLRNASKQVLKGYKQDESAFMLLPGNQEALEWRLAMIDHATTSLDMKYFIWEADEAGYLMLERIIRAAGRGVRVRLLIDDMTMSASDATVSMLSSLKNMELRIYNPVRHRGLSGWLDYLGKRRHNQRMHNKLMVVDGHWAIAGGRNIGNSYFGLSEKYNFRDLDVLITGALLPELSHAFDEYWNCPQVYPGDQLVKKPMGKKRKKLASKVGEKMGKAEPILRLSPYPSARQDWSDRFNALPEHMVAGTAEYYHDSPDYGGKQRVRMLDILETNQPPPVVSATYVSPYFLPNENMLKGMQKMVDDGVEVSLLTASLAANNHTPVHSHYKKYRRQILATGTALYEFDSQPKADVREVADTDPIASAFISLHVKAGVVDSKRLMIGSLNLDPRAMDLNTENLMIIHSEPLALQLEALIDDLSGAGNAWQVTGDKKLRWRSGDETLKRVPARSGWQRVSDFIYRWLPIESQL